jgi:hypothetical protein
LFETDVGSVNIVAGPPEGCLPSAGEELAHEETAQMLTPLRTWLLWTTAISVKAGITAFPRRRFHERTSAAFYGIVCPVTARGHKGSSRDIHVVWMASFRESPVKRQAVIHSGRILREEFGDFATAEGEPGCSERARRMPAAS